MMKETDITPGRWERRDGLIVNVIGVAPHTEANYKLVIFHPEDNPKDIQATPVSVWTELHRSGGNESTLFRKLDGRINFVALKTKKLAELTAGDIPPGLDPEDVATDA